MKIMKNMTIETAALWQFSILAVVSVALVLIPELAFASQTVGTSLCNIAEVFDGSDVTNEGNVPAAIATIAVCSIGAAACVGRVQWTTAIVVATGIAVMFGAASLVKTMAGNNSCT